MKRLPAALFAAAFFLSACDQHNASATYGLPDEVFQAVYGADRYPADFYTDSGDDGLRTWYVGFNVYDGVPGPNTPCVWQLPCADSVEGARALIRQAGVEESLGAGRSTDRHFEFDVESENLRARVYRCDLLREVAFGVLTLDGAIGSTPPSYVGGVVRLGPVDPSRVTEEEVRELIDEVWFYREHRLRGAFVLERTAVEAADAVTYEMLEGRTVFASRGTREASARCDKITVFRTRYRADKATGSVAIDREAVAHYSGYCP
ncbi:hypothetical protein BH23BAC4_BH23BAC4_03460 [soil metagenome]